MRKKLLVFKKLQIIYFRPIQAMLIFCYLVSIAISADFEVLPAYLKSYPDKLTMFMYVRALITLFFKEEKSQHYS